MIKKLLLGTFFLSTNLFSVRDSSQLFSEPKNNFFSLKREDNRILVDDIIRTNNLLEAFYLVKNNQKIPHIKNYFYQLCEFFFGLSVNLFQMNQLEEEKIFVQKLLASAFNFNSTCSNDLKYLFDMKLKCILEQKKTLLIEIKNEKIYDFILLSYFTSAFFFQPQKLKDDRKSIIDEFEREIMFDEMFESLKQDIYDLASLSDFFIYKEFETKVLRKIKNQKLFYNFMILNDMLLEKISQISGIHRFFEKQFTQCNKSFFSTEDFSFQLFGFWLLDKDAIKRDLLQMMNEDFLLLIHVLIRIQRSVISLKNSHYKEITEEELDILNSVFLFAESFMTKISDIIDLEDRIKIDKLQPIIISEKRIKRIVNKLSLLITGHNN